VSPVFRHGRLRLYLLKLLDESPRHGYEVIRLLQDRFMGVYAPSPGTIYPRLARLEEDGLVTHEEVDGKKVYSITDKGREEIRSRLSDLADLEDELSESLRDVAREISEDVRDTVRSIREELTAAAREFRSTQEGKTREPEADTPRAGESNEAFRIREEARRNREQMRASFRAQGRSRSDWAAWQQSTDKLDGGLGSWGDWFSGFEDWFGGGKAAKGQPDSAEAAGAESGEHPEPAEGTGEAAAGKRGRRTGQNPFSDLERMAMQFATELRAAARQTGNLGERSLTDLRDILTDTLSRVRTEVFDDRAAEAGTGSGDSDEAGATPATDDDQDPSTPAS